MRTIVLFFSFLIFGCSNPTEVEDVEIESNISDKKLLVENNMNHDIYYLVVYINCFALVDLKPRFNGPMIEARMKKTVPFNDISCGNDLKDGDELIFHWWTNSAQNVSDIKSIIITL